MEAIGDGVEDEAIGDDDEGGAMGDVENDEGELMGELMAKAVGAKAGRVSRQALFTQVRGENRRSISELQLSSLNTCEPYRTKSRLSRLSSVRERGRG